MDFVNTVYEKQIFINDLKINYIIFGEGNIPIILLHGWGIDSSKYIETAKQLILQAKSYEVQTRIIIPDLPGFGKSDEPPQAWGIDDYMELVKKFIELSLQGIDNIILIGHSFGGRIAIKFAAKYPDKVKALILTGAAGIKHPLSIKQKIFFVAAKLGKIFFSLPIINKLEKTAQKVLYKAAREKDYYQTQGVMKETFKKVIAEDLTPYLEKIITPTLLLWGRNDHSTPLKDGEILHFKIQNSKFKIVAEANHSLPYQYPEKFAKIVAEFIKKY